MVERKGFTLVEVAVVILIVAILATALVPMLRMRIDAAKWSEGRAMMGTIASSIRAYLAENDGLGKLPGYSHKDLSIQYADKDDLGYDTLGLLESDFIGTYFSPGNFDWTVEYDPRTHTFIYTIEGYAIGIPINSPVMVTLNESGQWTEAK